MGCSDFRCEMGGRRRPRYLVRLSLLFLVLWSSIASADEAPAPPPGPRKVVIGVYVNQVTNVDLKNNKLDVDFYVWFRWEGKDDLKLLDSFDVANGRITSKSGIVKRTYGTQTYVSCRVLATLVKFWDLRRYPLDDHTVDIVIEDTDKDIREVVYEADLTNAKIAPELHVPGWDVVASRGHVTTHVYHSNYGDITLPAESKWARYTYSIDIERPGWGRLFKVFFGLFVSVLVAWCQFWTRPKEHAPPRITLGVGATFASAAVTVSINNSMPDANTMTLADKLVILTLCSIVASVIVTIVAFSLSAREKHEQRVRMDRICQVMFPATYFAVLAYFVM
jgi:hypothetical protein